METSRKLLKALAVILILSFLALPATASAPDAADQSVRRATLPPALDGNLSDWDGIPAMVLDLDTRAPNSSAGVERSDALYTLQMLQTADALYLGLHARDEKLVVDSGAELFKDDSLRFSVDGNKDGLGGSASDHAYRIRIDGKAGDGATPITALTVITSAVTGGYNMEIKIPATALALPLGSTSFKFNWAADDDDNGGGLDTFYLYAGTQADTPETSWPTATLDGEAFTPVGLLEAGRWEWYGGGSLGAVYAGSGGTAWAGANGVWKTTNNGTNWNRWPLFANAAVSDLRFWDANRGLALAGNKVYLTEDGGATWRLSYDAGNKSLGRLLTSGTDTAYLTEREVFGYLGPEHERVVKSRDGGASWSTTLDPEGETAFIRDLAAYGADRAWALEDSYEYSPMLRWTLNGGGSWSAASVADAGGAIDPQSIAFADPLVGWLVGTQGSAQEQVWRTLDGGETWQKQNLGVSEATKWLIAFDANTAWLAAGNRLFRTTDGVNWYKVSDSAPDRLSFRSPTEGWGIKGRAIQRSTDGGATWKTVYTPTDPPLSRWWDHLRGWRIDGGIIERTTDGGGTWTPVNTGLQAVDHLQMVTPLVGWAWHDASLALRKTTDGGITWKTQATGSDTLSDLQFVDTAHGWVRDTASNLRRTIDGGTSWQLVTRPPDPDGVEDPTVFFNRALYFVNANVGIAGVRRTTVADDCANYYSRTADGGMTWSALQAGPSNLFTFGAGQIGWGVTSCETRYAPVPAETLSKTANGGAAWEELALNYMTTIDLHAQDAEQLFRFSYEVSVEKSSDGGNSFQRQRAEAPSITLRSRPDRLYHEEPGSPTARMIYRNTEIPAYRTYNPPRMDGNLDDWGRAWQTSLKTSNAATAQGGIPAPLQSSGVLRALWDANNLYLAVQVRDDDYHVDSPTQPWNDDAVELALDPAHDHIYLTPDDDRQYTINADGAQYLFGAATSGLEVGRQQTADGYILEVRIPKALAPSLKLQPGGVAGFNWTVIDDMDGGPRETALFWTGSLTSRAQASWGQIRFSAIDAETKPSADTPTPTPTVTVTATPTPTETPQPDSYNLSGKVYNDANGNGQLDQGEMGVVSVGLSLFKNGTQIGQAATDGAGNYLFGGLAAGQYTVKAQQPAWLPISTTPNEITVAITNGPATVNFGDWVGLRIYLPLVTNR